MFLNLHRVNDNVVLRNLKDVLQQNLPKDLPNETVKTHTSKSWRKGMVTFMVPHPTLDDEFACARSKHTMGGNAHEFTNKIAA